MSTCYYTYDEFNQAHAEGKTLETDPKFARTLYHPTLFMSYFKRRMRESQTQRHIYMVTFTLRPDKVDAEDHAQELIEAQAQRTALKILEFHLVKERTKNGIAHWHACIVTSTPLKKDRFNYYVQKFGNIDIAKNKAQQTSEILNYMTKTGEINRLK